MLLYLVRHGHTEHSDSGKIAGFTDVNLSDKGRRSASALAKSLPQPAPAQCYSSHLVRAAQTLELVASPIDPIQDSRLGELNFGDWEGLTWDEVHQRDAGYLERWSDNWFERAPPGGETFIELAQRTREWFSEFSQTLEASPTDSSVIVAAHGGSIRALVCQLLDLPLESAFKFSIDHTHVTTIKLSKQGHHQMRCLNANYFPK